MQWALPGLAPSNPALFNNLGAPKTSTLFNLLKATVFTIPFVWLGAHWFGAPGVLIGQGLGSAIIALAGWYWCRRWVTGLPLVEARVT